MPLKTSNFRSYLKLMRADRPIGFYLVLWPALWALAFAAEGEIPSLHLVAIFSVGAFLMRSAGCVINDYADRHWDGEVERTRQRPLVTQEVSAKEALSLFSLLCVLAAILLVFLDSRTRFWSIGALALAILYPFTKRFSHFPQVVLGTAFAWAVPMAYTAQSGEVTPTAWVLFAAVVTWVIIYDTFYAMVDRADDIKAGIKSTAIFFGRYDRLITSFLQLLFLTLMLTAGAMSSFSSLYYLSLFAVLCLFGYQQFLIRNRDVEHCFKAFLHNNYVGWSIFIGLIAQAMHNTP